MAGDRFCGACGTRAVGGDRFCGACGADLATQTIPSGNGDQGSGAQSTPPSIGATATSEVTTPASAPPHSTVPSIRTLGRAIMAVVVLSVVSGALVGIGALLVQNDTVLASDEALGAGDALIGVGSILTLGSLLVGAILTLIWLHRAYSSLSPLGISGSRYGTGQAVWPWFVPIFSLWRPVQVVNDTYRGLSVRVRFPGLQPVTFTPADAVAPIIPIWWAAWLIGSFLGNALSQSETPLGNGIYAVTVIISGVAFLLVVFRITELHEDARQGAG
jgi:hypothetical protein